MGHTLNFTPLPLASSYTSSFAVLAVLLALRQCEITGLGDIVEVPLSSGLMEGLCFNSVCIENLPLRYKCLRERAIERQAESVEIQKPFSYQEVLDHLDPFFQTYTCKDNRHFYLVCPSHQTHQVRLLRALGLSGEFLSNRSA